MPWLQLRFHISAERAPELETALLDSGCCAVTLQDAGRQPLFELERGSMPLWEQLTVVGLYRAEQSEDAIVAQVRRQLARRGEIVELDYRSEIVEDKAWERAWLERFSPLQFGRQLWVCPTEAEVPDPDALTLRLDPGLAFGTGTHPTTAMCLQWLTERQLEHQRVVDYGCGSGILGIAACLLGATSMLGLDNDPQALTTANANAERNLQRDARYDFSLPTPATPDTAADIVLANILAGPLIQLAGDIVSWLKPGGSLALSGILREQANAVGDAYRAWIDFEPPQIEQDWVCLTGRRNSVPLTGSAPRTRTRQTGSLQKIRQPT